jgi:hypothetical protein
MTFRVFGDTYPVEKLNFILDPNEVVVKRDYYYKFDIEDFFTSNTPIHSIMPMIRTFDPLTYAPIYNSMPAWLKFDE